MIRTQIMLTPEQHEALGCMAKERGTSKAALIRQAVEAMLETEERRRKKGWEKFLALSGIGSSGTGDVSINHDEEFARAIMDPGGLELER